MIWGLWAQGMGTGDSEVWVMALAGGRCAATYSGATCGVRVRNWGSGLVMTYLRGCEVRWHLVQWLQSTWITDIGIISVTNFSEYLYATPVWVLFKYCKFVYLKSMKMGKQIEESSLGCPTRRWKNWDSNIHWFGSKFSLFPCATRPTPYEALGKTAEWLSPCGTVSAGSHCVSTDPWCQST